MRKAKILATLGPSSSSKEMMIRLIENGANAFRFNFSHGTYEQHRELYRTARKATREKGWQAPLIQDLQGPKIRVSLPGPVRLEDGDTVFLTADEAEAGNSTVFVSYPPLCEDVGAEEPVLLNDGKIVLRVTDKDSKKVKCRVLVGGLLEDKKGMNLPCTKTTLSPLSEKDLADLRFGMEMGFDYVALSFVQSGEDIRLLKSEMDKLGRRIPVIAKLERPLAVENLENIIDETDAVMVARGDLGIEIPVEQIPVIQKKIIAAANRRGIPVITATQMLESMMETTTPTRAETTDIANAIYDGTDVVMLSGETSTGKYPAEAVHMMRSIIREAEPFTDAYTKFSSSFSDDMQGKEITTAHLAAAAAGDIGIRAIVVYTQTGRTANLISKLRPHTDIFAFCPHAEVVRRMGLLWGITPIPFPVYEYTEGLIEGLNDELLKRGYVQIGDLVAITYGSPIPAKNQSNMLKIHRIE
ncbi:MAG: pyruvate kinase [Desulfococcaceae bacterium]|jgi:pyruvate kinase|nr:pyruvate kinase [Desulfococcaceae bacterium]